MKRHIAINGKRGMREINTDGKCTQVEWIGEYDNVYYMHFAYRWKETAKAIYYKWVY